MTFRLPTFNPPQPFHPVRLPRAAQRLGNGAIERKPRPDDSIAARAFLASAGGAARTEDAYILRGLADLLPVLEPTQRRHALTVLIAADGRRWRNLWSAWLHCDDEQRPRVAARLASILQARARARRSFAKRHLPQWMPTDPSMFGSALRQPKRFIYAWLRTPEAPAPHELPRGLESSLQSGLISTLVRLQLGSGGEWSNRSDVYQLTNWASDRGAAWIAAAAAACLVRVGGDASSAADLATGVDVDQVRSWCLRHLGEPAQHPGQWAQVGPRGAQIFEWLMLKSRFDKIMAEFHRLAQRDRAEFWSGYFGSLSDAMLTRAHGPGGQVAVCLMRFGDLLAIEFGTVGNACYFYRFSGAKMALRQIPRQLTGGVSHYKRKMGLRLNSVSLPFLKSLNHARRWTRTFENFLSLHGISPDHQRRNMRTLKASKSTPAPAPPQCAPNDRQPPANPPRQQSTIPKYHIGLGGVLWRDRRPQASQLSAMQAERGTSGLTNGRADAPPEYEPEVERRLIQDLLVLNGPLSGRELIRHIRTASGDEASTKTCATRLSTFCRHHQGAPWFSVTFHEENDLSSATFAFVGGTPAALRAREAAVDPARMPPPQLSVSGGTAPRSGKHAKLGQKIVCNACQKPFYDLNRVNPECPSCHTLALAPITSTTTHEHRRADFVPLEDQVDPHQDDHLLIRRIVTEHGPLSGHGVIRHIREASGPHETSVDSAARLTTFYRAHRKARWLAVTFHDVNAELNSATFRLIDGPPIKIRPREGRPTRSISIGELILAIEDANNMGLRTTEARILFVARRYPIKLNRTKNLRWLELADYAWRKEIGT